LREAFLLQMNYFDRVLESSLRDMLDPVVTVQPPRRRGRNGTRQRVVELAPAPETTVAEPVAVTIPVTRAL
jgi:hypothetical protein